MSTLFKIETERELESYLKELYLRNKLEIIEQTQHFEICKSGYYSGCNYWINKGENEWEPLGTATSMHDCDGCDKLSECQLKKKNDIWYYRQ